MLRNFTNMIKQINQVKEFFNSFKVTYSDTPTTLTNERAELRHRILLEEVNELLEATKKGDKIETLDAIIDCMYILIGTALETGLHDFLEEAFNEVHTSNMSKLDELGNPIYREDGKILKSSLYRKPDLKSILEK